MTEYLWKNNLLAKEITKVAKKCQIKLKVLIKYPAIKTSKNLFILHKHEALKSKMNI